MTNHEQTISQFAALFRGRTDAHGVEHGGCRRVDPSSWEDVWAGHLMGSDPIGVYPLVNLPQDQHDHLSVHWMCSDLDIKPKPGADYADTDEAYVAAKNLQRALNLLSIPSHIEITRSGGGHVWVFLAEPGWISAEPARRAMLVAHRIADVRPTEVNPKSTKGVELGNYVRLPYPGTLGLLEIDRAPERRVMLGPEGARLRLPEFLELMLKPGSKAAPSAIESAAGLWVANTEEQAVSDIGEPPELSRDITSQLNGLAWTIFNRGPLDGADRSTTLFKLACCCRDSGLVSTDALAVVIAADESWGQKYVGRADADARYRTLIGKAYQQSQPLREVPSNG